MPHSLTQAEQWLVDHAGEHSTLSAKLQAYAAHHNAALVARVAELEAGDIQRVKDISKYINEAAEERAAREALREAGRTLIAELRFDAEGYATSLPRLQKAALAFETALGEGSPAEPKEE